MRERILIVAGEASGDRHGARLVGELGKILPGVQVVGIGGEALAAQGVRLLARAEDLAVVGLTEVLGRLPAVLQALDKIRRLLRQEPPALVILIDFPDFNFLVARLAKWAGVPVMYYISPQVWAWRRYRARTLARYVARLAVIFPFEAEFYRQRGVAADFVGHPLMETLPELPERKLFLAGWGLDPESLTLALLPGSRGSEIARHLPVMLAAARLIQRAIPEAQFILPLASTAPRGLVEGMVEEFLGGGPGNAVPCPPPKPPSQPFEGLGEGGGGRGQGLPTPRPLPQKTYIQVIPGQSFAVLSAAHLAVVASGTVTVEAALAGTPTVIIYRLAPLTYQLARLLIRVNHIGMANLLAGEAIFPELIQDELTPEGLAQEVLQWVREPARLPNLGVGLARVVAGLGGPGASKRAARMAVEIIRAREGLHPGA
ncbi:MAG: lipid-A-disaccharide synthase [Desulfobaccales bacterium]